MEELLKLWEIPANVMENFRINGIEVAHLPHINDEFLKELCPVLGVRITLKNKIAEYNDAQATTESNKSATTAISDTEEIPVIGDLTFSFEDLLENKSTFPDFDLKTLLTTSPCGNSILQYYITHKQLDTKRKNRLTDIIIRHLFTFIINHRLSYDDYNVITGKIISLFPKESPGTYFTRPIKKADSNRGKSMPARGKLIDKVRNLLFQSGERKRSQAKTCNDETVTKKTCLGLILELHREDIQWLKNNDEPWTEVLNKWNSTVEVRHGKDYKNIHEFMTEWKILKNPKSVELIDQDFNFLYPDKADNFSDNWHNFFEKLIELKKHEIDIDDHKEKLVLSLNALDNNEDKIPTQLTLLVNLIPPKGRYSKKIKISMQECLESIMVIIDNPGDLDTTLRQQKEKALARKLQVQPYLIILGCLQKVHQLYLVLDEITYTFDSVQKAFDILWKSYHVFNAKYPKASDHVHLVIQRCVYKITTKFDNPAPYISDILKLTN